MENQYVIRPEPTVFEDYKDEKFEISAETSNESASLKKIISSQGTLVYITERVEYPENGMLMKYKDVPYFRQGFVFPEAMDNVNNLKRVTVLFLAFFKGKGIKGRIGTVLAHYCWLADWMFQWYDPNSRRVRQIYLKENRYRQSVRELIKLINGFLDNLGIQVFTPETSKKNFGKVVGTMIENDNAYHWRMEDIFLIMDYKNLLKNPRKELKRVKEVYKTREKTGIDFKLEQIVKILRFILLIPSVKKAFRKTLKGIDFKKLRPTNGKKGEVNDTYFMMNYEGYDFQGKPLEERQKIWFEMTDGKPPERVRIPAQ